MSENDKNPTAQNSNVNSGKQSNIARNPQTGEFQKPTDTDNGKNAKDWLGGPQNGNETASKDADGSDVAWSGRGKASSGNLQVNGRGRVPGAKIEDPPEYNVENARNAKEGSDWLGGPQNGNETSGKEGAYQTASHSTGWEDQKKK